MNFDSEKVLSLLHQCPRDFSFRGRALRIFPLAINEFDKLSKERWSLDNYKISVGINEDESYAAISFVPDPVHSVEGIPFEMADRGMYKNGEGVVYIYRLADLALAKTTYMR